MSSSRPMATSWRSLRARIAVRHLVLVNALKGKIMKSIPMDIEQQIAPTWSPDGRRIAFAGWQAGNFDIFEIDLETEEVTNLTNDHIYDAAPVYSPDGKWMAISSTVGGYSKIFRVNVDDPTQRLPLREGLRSQTNETDAVFSPDGQRLYFTSDASGANNIFSFDLESGLVQQHTDAITGCFQPTVLGRAHRQRPGCLHGLLEGSLRPLSSWMWRIPSLQRRK